jgi:vanillate O-demethylase monooxygenase subunit
VEIPTRQGVPIPRDARVRTYHCQEAYGLVWVCLADIPKFDIPAFPEYADTSFHKLPLRAHEPWEVSATRLVMSSLDDSHFPWVHAGILGDPDHPEPPDHRVWYEGDYLVSAYTVRQVSNSTISDGTSQDAFEEVEYVNYVTPNTVRLVKRSKIGTYALWNAYTPMSYNRTRTFTHIARTFDKDPKHDHVYEEFNLLVKSQDRRVVEGQRPWLLPPLSSRLLLYIRPADLPIVAFQKWMEKLHIPQI